MTSSPEPVIRRAGPADAAVVAELRDATFIEAFAHCYRPEDLAAFLAHAHSEPATRRLLEEPGVAMWLAEHGGRAVGYATAGPCKLPLPGLESGAGELRQLYVRAEYQKLGLGTHLLALALDWLTAQGRAPLYVGCWSENGGALRLYARHGFREKVGEYDFPVGEQLDREHILRRASGGPTAGPHAASPASRD